MPSYDSRITRSHQSLVTNHASNSFPTPFTKLRIYERRFKTSFIFSISFVLVASSADGRIDGAIPFGGNSREFLIDIRE